MLPKVRHYRNHVFSSLKVRNYRLYFTGQAISQSGTWIQTIAQTWLVLQLTHSGTDIGLLTAVQFLPILLLAPFGGVIADRFSKRKILYFTQFSALLLALILAVLVGTHEVQVWMVFVLAACLGLVNVVDSPTRQSFVIEMVGIDEVRNAVTLNSIEVNMARVIGPAIAGVLIADVGLAWCFLINSVSYIAVLTCLYLMDSTALNSVQRNAQKMRGQLKEGFQYVKHTPVLRNVLLMMALIGTFSYEFQVVLPLFASRTFHGDASAYALLTAAMGLGSVIGGLITASRRQHTRFSLVVAATVFGIFMLLTAVAGEIDIAALLLVGVGIGSISFTSMANSTLQLESAPEMRGRVMSLWTLTFLGSTPIGGPIIGLISDRSSPRFGLLTGGIVAVIVGVVGIVALRKHAKLTSPSQPV
jgi:MFS family permease